MQRGTQPATCPVRELADTRANHHHNGFTALFRDHPGEPVPKENFCILSRKGRLTEADTPTIWLGATPSGLTSAYLYHPPIFFHALPAAQPTAKH